MSEDLGGEQRSIERAVLMHGTSPFRMEAAGTLAKLVRESGAHGAAYGWTDDLAPARLAPVHSVAGGPSFHWPTTLSPTFARRIHTPGLTRWHLVLRGSDRERSESLGPLLSLAASRLQSAEMRDCPTIPRESTSGADGAFIAMIDALRFVGFTPVRQTDLPHLADEMRVAAASLPTAVRTDALAVTECLDDHAGLTESLLAFARRQERVGRLAAGAALYVILYELALLRCDGHAGLDAAHGAGRTFRKLTDWREALRWYQLGLRLALYDDDFLRAARLLDGLGNTHRERGSFPAARRCYRDAARMAVVAGDPVEIANVALGLMTVEREAGRLDTAARIAWQALTSQTDPVQRVNLLLNLGTLLRDGGAIDLAEDTYRLVDRAADDAELRLMSLDALAYCAALRSDAAGYEERRAAVRGVGRAASPYIRAQIGFFRGASLRALGDPRAIRVLRATERYARSLGLREWEVRAAALAEAPRPRAAATVRAPQEVEVGIRRLLATAAAGTSRPL